MRKYTIIVERVACKLVNTSELMDVMFAQTFTTGLWLLNMTKPFVVWVQDIQPHNYYFKLPYNVSFFLSENIKLGRFSQRKLCYRK